MLLDKALTDWTSVDVAGAPRVLVVDDEEAVMLTLKNVLELDGYAVTGTTSAAEARDLVNNQDFDLLLTDLKLDGVVDGVQLVKALHDRSADAAAVMLTGYASLESAVSALREGACEYLSKPCDVVALRTTVSRRIERVRQAAEERGRANVLAAELRRCSASTGEFVSNVSHDLKTPLTFIKGLAGLRRRRAAQTPQTEPLLDALQQIEACADRMARQLDVIADSART